jgi:peptidyl-prolyl cis-trans isomerase D
MITRLQNFFLKHNKWLFGGLLIVIIVTFVLTIGPQSFFGGPSLPDRRDMQYYGYNLSSASDQQALFGSAEISASLSPELGIRRDQISDYAYMRAAGLGLADELGIPSPTSSQMEAYIRRMAIFQDPETGEFSSETYNQLLTMFQTNTQFSREAVARVMRQDWRIKRVRDTLGGPGVELPWELKQDFISRETTYDIVMARASYTDFRPELNPDEAVLREFYDNNFSRYEESDKIRVKALYFMPDRYVNKVTIDDDSLRTYFNRNRFRYEADREFPEDLDPDDMPQLTLDDVRIRVEADYRREAARRLAEQSSEKFSLEIWENEIRRTDPAFQELLESYQVEVEELQPYPRNRTPNHQRINRQLLNSMWIYASGGTRYFSDIGQMSGGGAVVLIFQELIPERLPPFEEVANAVEADWKNENRRRLFSEQGHAMRSLLQQPLAEGRTFIQAAEELGLSVQEFEPFSGNDVPETLQRSAAWAQGRYLSEGAVSRMNMEADSGIFIFMRSKISPEADFESEAFLAFVEEQEDFLGQAKGWARLREITDRTLGKISSDLQGLF